MNETYDKLKRIIIEQLGVEESQVTPEAHFDADLAADSLDEVELAMSIEDEFNISITDEETEATRTVAQALALIESKLK